MQKDQRIVAFALGVATAFMTIPASANYDINFDNHDSISWILAKARSTDANLTYQKPDGSLGLCPLSSNPYDDQQCWNYSQAISDPKGNFWFDIYGLTDSHYHLAFEDPAYNNDCVAPIPDNLGIADVKKINGVCQPPVADYAAEPRYLLGHVPQSWITMSSQNATTGEYQPFHVAAIRILNTSGQQRGGSAIPLQVDGLSAIDGDWYTQTNMTGPAVQVVNFAIIGLWYFDVGPDASSPMNSEIAIGDFWIYY